MADILYFEQFGNMLTDGASKFSGVVTLPVKNGVLTLAEQAPTITAELLVSRSRGGLLGIRVSPVDSEGKPLTLKGVRTHYERPSAEGNFDSFNLNGATEGQIVFMDRNTSVPAPDMLGPDESEMIRWHILGQLGL